MKIILHLTEKNLFARLNKVMEQNKQILTERKYDDQQVISLDAAGINAEQAMELVDRMDMTQSVRQLDSQNNKWNQIEVSV